MKRLLLLGVICLLAAFVVPALAAAPAAPTAAINMSKGGKKVVVFNHTTHAALKCADCHHPVDGKEDFRACGTAGCHEGMDKKDPMSYYSVMHNTKGAKFQTCVSCHIATAGADKDKKKELAGCAKSKCHP